MSAERNITMTKIFSVTALALATAMLAGCGNRDLTTGSIPDDYRTRHPITLAEAEHAIDIPVAPSDSRLTIGMRDTIKGFAQDFGNSSAGIVQIQVPQGSYNASAAAYLASEIRRTLTANGISKQRILMAKYQAAPTGDAAPIRLSYFATKAVTGACGNWPADVGQDTFGNKNWHNFGCASQNNLAAQISNPTDLVSPRGMTPIDAAQRSNVISDYRGGSGSTTTISISNN